VPISRAEWGHRRTEPSKETGTIFVAGTFVALGAYIAWSIVGALLHREAPNKSLVGIGLAVASLIVMRC
jgi:divalent metal cation (Fe/Co/Zn/Cd) transporter